jgi:hypothetical protein
VRDRAAAIDFLFPGGSTATAADSASAVTVREAIEGQFVSELIAHGTADSLARAAGIPLQDFCERLADVLFLVQSQQTRSDKADER